MGHHLGYGLGTYMIIIVLKEKKICLSINITQNQNNEIKLVIDKKYSTSPRLTGNPTDRVIVYGRQLFSFP